MANNLNRVHKSKWQGIYCYKSDTRKHQGKPDVCFYLAYKVGRSRKTEKVGWKSEGYSPEVAAALRADRIKADRHGEDALSAKQLRIEKQKTNRTIGDLKRSYFESARGLSIKGRAVDLNRYQNHLHKAFSKKRVDILSPLDIERIKRDMRKHAPATVFNALELLRRIINFGVDQKLSPSLSFKIKFPKKDNEVTEYLSPEEARRLMDVLEHWPRQDIARMLRIAWLTGMRRGEIFKLQDNDCDFIQKLIKLKNPKGGKTAEIPMSPPVEAILKEQIQWREERSPGSLFIFPGLYGKQRTNSGAVRRIKEKADLPKSFRIFHGLRHHMAVTLASSGEFTIGMIGELLTHKSDVMTRRYIDYLPGAKRKASTLAADLLQAHVDSGTTGKVAEVKRDR